MKIKIVTTFRPRLYFFRNHLQVHLFKFHKKERALFFLTLYYIDIREYPDWFI